MNLLPIKLTPGAFRNGTIYDARTRWYETNLVRWFDGSLRPIGGWQRRTTSSGAHIDAIVSDPSTEVVRNGITYRDNSGATLAVFGSNAALYAMSVSGMLSDITPTGFTGTNKDVTDLIGFGIGSYGVDAYGAPRNPADAKPVPVGRWSLDMWGENVLALFDAEGLLYEYPPGDAQAVEIATAPDDLIDFVVTNERIVLGIRNTPEIREAIWSDREDNTDWTPAADNYAGSYRLPGKGLLLGIYRVQNQYLILSESDAFIASYQGAPFVYSILPIGEGCAPIDKNAVAAVDRFAIWLADSKVWRYDGTLQEVQCDIMDYIKETLDPQQVSKMFTMVISEFSEIWWFYQSKTSDVVDKYVCFNYARPHWTFGNLSRSFGTDKGAYRSPIMVDLDGYIYNHEQPAILVEGAYAMTGPLELENGSNLMAVRMLIPDTKTTDSVKFRFYSQNMPQDAFYDHGEFTFPAPISTSGVMGRNILMRVEGLLTAWRCGVPRLDVQDMAGTGSR